MWLKVALPGALFAPRRPRSPLTAARLLPLLLLTYLLPAPRHERPPRAAHQTRAPTPGLKIAQRLLPVSASVGSCLVLLHHAGGDTPARTDRDAMVVRPSPDIAAALTAGGGLGRPVDLPAPGLAGMLDERRRLLAERAGMLLAQVDLILHSAPPTLNRTVSAAGPPSRSSSSTTVTLRAIPTSCTCAGCSHRTHRLPSSAADHAQNPG